MNDLTEVRRLLEDRPDARMADAYAVRMWRHVLDHHARPPDEHRPSRDDSGALPYLPVMPEELQCPLARHDEILDAGCLGGYGLFDLAVRRRAAGQPIPRLRGLDADAVAIDLARHMRPAWGQDTDLDFVRADVGNMPFEDHRFRVVIARLLLPYVNIDAALREMTRVLSPGGLLYLQSHGPRYYARQLCRNPFRPRAALYYLCPLLAAAAMQWTGHQPRHPRLRETALSRSMLNRLALRHGLAPCRPGQDRLRPFVILRHPL